MQLNRTPNALTKADRDNLNKNWTALEEEINKLGPAPALAELAKRAAEQANAKTENVQKQLNAFVVNGDSSPQATQASVGADGTEYEGNLKARLDAEHNTVTAKLAEKVGKDVVWSMANMGQDVKEQMTGGSVAVVGKNAVLEENIVDNQLSPRKTTFLKLNKAKNMFDGNYTDRYIGGASGSLSLTAETRKAKVAIISIEPNTAYSVALSPDIDTFLKMATSTKLMETAQIFDGKINEANGAGVKNIVITTGPNDKFLYVNTTLENPLRIPFLKVVKSTTIKPVTSGEEYPIEPVGVQIYNKQEVDAKVSKPVPPEQTTFLDFEDKNLFDGNFIDGEYLAGSIPLTLSKNAAYKLVAIPAKPNTTYSILKAPVEREDGNFYFKLATSTKPLNELLNRSANFVMDGISYSSTSADVTSHIFTTGPGINSILFNVAKYAEPYTEVLEGEHYNFLYDDYNQGSYKFNINIDNLGVAPENNKPATGPILKKIDAQNFVALFPFPSGNYVGYSYGVDIDTTINLDVWRLKDLAIYNPTLGKITSITSGDNEGVLRIAGQGDYIGGIHGDEKTTAFVLYVDGIRMAVADLKETQPFKSIEIFVASDLYDADTPVHSMWKIKHVKIDDTGFYIKNVWDPLRTVELTHVRACILSIHKKAGDIDLITTYRDNVVNLFPQPVPPNGTTATMPNSPDITEISFFGGLVSAQIWSIKRGGTNNQGNVTDFGTRLKAYLDSYTGETIPARTKIIDEHKFLITTR